MGAPRPTASRVYFVPVSEIPTGFSPGGSGRLDRYRVREVRSIRGKAPEALRSGCVLARIESETPIRFFHEDDQEPRGPLLQGVVQHVHYTGRAERSDLEAISRPEMPGSAETAAVLIPIGKSAAWWKLGQDEREIFFQKTARHEGHLAIGRKYADRIFRRLYHTRYIDPAAPHDFLTYFEFNEADAPDFRKMLAELREVENNPEWFHVELEYEVWMTKLPPGTTPFPEA